MSILGSFIMGVLVFAYIRILNPKIKFLGFVGAVLGFWLLAYLHSVLGGF